MNHIPKIGDYWPDQGGIYAGIARGRDGAPDHHLILAVDAPATEFNWQAALDHAKTITAEGHTDFRVPDRWESALLYANVRDHIANSGDWYWTATEASAGRAIVHGFEDGYQDDHGKPWLCQCAFVRSVAVEGAQ